MKGSKFLLVHTPERVVSAAADVASFARSRSGLLSSALDAIASIPLVHNRLPKSKTGGKAAALNVGLWDLGAYFGGIKRIIEGANSAQKSFVFWEVQASVPLGLAKRSTAVADWFERNGHAPTAQEREEMEADLDKNVIADEFFEYADSIRADLGLDYIVGISPSMLATVYEGEVYWNLFATFSKKTVIASTYELREYGRQAQRPFEVMVAGVIVAQLLVARFFPKLHFHDDRGCFFDYHEDRSTIVSTAREPRIEPSCMEAIDPAYRPATEALLEFLRNYGRK